jgi:hypothetical protein
MALQTVRVVLHLAQPVKGISMGIFFPFLEIFEMTKAAFPVADVVRLFFSEGLAVV